MSTESASWQRCNICKSPIRFSQIYWVCNVSTCNRKPTAMVFCTVSCWDAHVPLLRHRDAWAIEKRAPSQDEWQREQIEAHQSQEQERRPRRIAPAAGINRSAGDAGALEILIVASKLKNYIKARSGMSTSAGVMNELSNRVRDLCNEAIRNAAVAERKTVLDRDIPQLTRRGSDSYGYD